MNVFAPLSNLLVSLNLLEPQKPNKKRGNKGSNDTSFFQELIPEPNIPALSAPALSRLIALEAKSRISGLPLRSIVHLTHTLLYLESGV